VTLLIGADGDGTVRPWGTGGGNAVHQPTWLSDVNALNTLPQISKSRLGSQARQSGDRHPPSQHQQWRRLVGSSRHVTDRPVHSHCSGPELVHTNDRRRRRPAGIVTQAHGVGKYLGLV